MMFTGEGLIAVPLYMDVSSLLALLLNTAESLQKALCLFAACGTWGAMSVAADVTLFIAVYIHAEGLAFN